MSESPLQFEGHIFRSVDRPAQREPFQEVIKLAKRHRDFMREAECAETIARENRASQFAPITSHDLAQLNSVQHESGAAGETRVRQPQSSIDSAAEGM
jgi:hypothetical protein